MPEQNPLNPAPVNVGGGSLIPPASQVPVSNLTTTPVQPQVPVTTTSPQPAVSAVAGSVPLAGATPAVPGFPVRPGAPLVKQGSQLSFTGLLIGCGVFVLLIVGFLGFAIYYLIQNPQLLSQFGLDARTATTLLSLFGGLFGAGLFFGGFGMTLVNGYRLATVPGPKGGYIVGLVVGIILLLGVLIGGTQAISMITRMNNDSIANGSKAVSPFVMEGSQRIPYTNQPLVAPVAMSFGLNNAALQGLLGSQIALSSVSQISLVCGNSQTLPFGSNGYFEGVCLYTAKQQYPMKLILRYTDATTKELLTGEVPLDPITIASVMSVTTSIGAPTTNDAMTELVISKPMRVFFDASKMISDLGLTNNEVSRDFDGDGKVDVENTSRPSFVYRESKLYSVSYTIGNQRQRFSFPLRVQESTEPQCDISGSGNTDNEYVWQLSLLSPTIKAKDYRREIVDAMTNRAIQTIKRSTPSLTYTLKPGSYKVVATFLADDGRQGSCETDIIEVASSDMDATLSLQYRTPTMDEFASLKPTGEVSMSGDTVLVGVLPTYMTINVDSIKPSPEEVDVQFVFNGKRILESSPGTYEVTISDSKDQTIELMLTNKQTSQTKKIIRRIINTQAKVLGTLTLSPDSAGMDPFEVTLDVSRVKLTDPDDEIVTFTRDFGDGQVSKNVNQGTVTHVYRFDTVKQSGEYRPSVIIKTKKGVTQTLTSKDPIIVKRATRTISIKTDSHPSQIAAVGDRVQLRIESNGPIESIRRDYGDGREMQECEGRSCIDTAVIYKEPGTYTIKATVIYTDHPAVSANLKVRVE